jgi:hypothetical protein
MPFSKKEYHLLRSSNFEVKNQAIGIQDKMRTKISDTKEQNRGKKLTLELNG